MSENESKDSMNDKRESPVIFAGKEYYKVVIDTVRACQMAMMTNNYEAWFRLLCSYFNATQMFMSRNDADTILQKINLVETQVYTVSDMVINNPRAKVEAARSLHFQLRQIEMEIFRASRELLLKTSRGDEERSAESVVEDMFT